MPTELLFHGRTPWQHCRVMLGSGISMHYVTMMPLAGTKAKGTVLCIHGFPDTWYGYRHQIRALASCGWHVIVPDQRGYGETDAPKRVEAYRMELLVGDMVGLMDVLGLQQVVLLGHDWGGTLVWNMTQQYPERVRAVASVCTPFFNPNPDKNPWHSMKAKPGRFDYQVWFNTAAAEMELSNDPNYTVRCIIRGTSESDQKRLLEHADLALMDKPPTEKEGWLAGMPPDELCPRSDILSEEDLNYYAAQFKLSGYFGPLSWYRNVEANWLWMKHVAGRPVQQPALMITAGRDSTLRASMVKSLGMHDWIPGLVHKHVEEAGHWVLAEQAVEVNAHICEWLATLPESASLPLFSSKL